MDIRNGYPFFFINTTHCMILKGIFSFIRKFCNIAIFELDII